MLGIWGEVLLDGELLGSCGGLEGFLGALLAVQPSPDHWASPDPDRLLAAPACVRASPGYQGNGFAAPDQEQQGAVVRSCQPQQELSLSPSWTENKTHSPSGLHTYERLTDTVQK